LIIGDFSEFNGTGGESIYGGCFPGIFYLTLNSKKNKILNPIKMKISN
jgi:hypothetical protein